MAEVIRDIAIQKTAAVALLRSLHDIIADDDEAAHDTIEGETDLAGAIERAVSRMTDIDAMTEALRLREDVLAARKKRLAEQKDRIKREIYEALNATGQRRFETPTATVFLRAGVRSAIITDESKIPEKYLIPQPPKINKALLNKDAREGEQIPGVTLSNGNESLNIRTT